MTAFAPVALAWAVDTGADLPKTNVNGRTIAMSSVAPWR